MSKDRAIGIGVRFFARTILFLSNNVAVSLVYITQIEMIEGFDFLRLPAAPARSPLS
jgi:hypothetical protein